MKQTLKEFGAGVRVAVGGLGRGAIKAMTAPLVGLHRFKPTPKLDAPAIRGGESAPVEVCRMDPDFLCPTLPYLLKRS